MQGQQLKFMDLTKGTHSFRMIGEPIQHRKHFVEKPTDPCPCMQVGSKCILFKDNVEVELLHLEGGNWVARRSDTGGEMLVNDAMLWPTCWAREAHQ